MFGVDTMATIKRFEDIESWQPARQLTKEIYAVTKRNGFEKDFGLKNQIQRASVSILSNIAEGFERNGNKEFLQFLSVAKGSAGEVRAQLYVALDQEYLDQQTFDSLMALTENISKKINGLMFYLRQTSQKGSKYK